MKKLHIFLILLLLLLPFNTAHASGFAIYTQGASSLAQGAATIAHIDDPSTQFFNPALINELEGTHLELGTTLIIPDRKFHSDVTDNSFDTEDQFFFPSTLFVTHNFNDKISIGLGICSPFGLSTDWPDDWEGRYIATTSEMTTYSVNPILSYKLLPNLNVSAGVEYLYLDASLEKKFMLPDPSTGSLFPDATQSFEGEGEGFGYNLGLLFSPHADISIGASYRSEIKVDIDGQADFYLPKKSKTIYESYFPNTGADTHIDLPQRVHLGICYKGFDSITIEGAVRWEGWSSFQKLAIDLNQPVSPLQETTFVQQRDWNDTWSFNIGMKYALNPKISLMAGYLYQNNPIPDHTFEASIPDSNGHLCTFGTRYTWNSWRLTLALGFQHQESRHKYNSIDDFPNDSSFNPHTSANGKYESNIFMSGVSIHYIF